ncbi:TnpV protein [Clostridium fessum]|uniref:TnpV protein n=1 Tax=Clostridium fessum TaxID=2126740 RepID=UPI002A80A667|nr:TnpV protein [Clostridium fessum]MDY4928660.1 TnpV protein [Clostridium fessum]
MEQSAMNTLPRHIHDERNGLDYTLYGDYYLPDLEVPPTPPLNHWGRTVFNRLQEHHPGRFSRMLLDGTLYPYCHDIGQQAQERFDALMQGYQRCWGINEALKSCDPMGWVGLMNLARAEAESIILPEILF